MCGWMGQEASAKSGTPTMGGVMIIIGVVVAALILGQGSNHMLLLSLLRLPTGQLAFGRLDNHPHPELLGLKARHKLFGQLLLRSWSLYMPYRVRISVQRY